MTREVEYCVIYLAEGVQYGRLRGSWPEDRSASDAAAIEHSQIRQLSAHPRKVARCTVQCDGCANETDARRGGGRFLE